MSLNITIPQPKIIKPKISVFGVGGAGGNALNNMISSNLEGVEFIAANTDAQALQNSLASNRIQLGLNTTKGLGAGSFPDRGKAAAEENVNEINKFLEGNNMIFIAAGMGGGTGTGAAPVIAKLAKEKDILTVGVVTKPFDFEGKYRMDAAIKGIEELKKYVDTLIVIPNQNLFRVANERTTFESAFKMADDVLHAGVRGITDLITMPGLVNLDFADIKTIMTKMGKAMMGTGQAEGDNRAVAACQEAISNPLLDDVSIKGAKGVLVNMTGGTDMTLFEADQAVNEIRKQVNENANIIFGSAFNEELKGFIRVSVVATGIDTDGEESDFPRSSHSYQNQPKEEDGPTIPNFFDPRDIQPIGSSPKAVEQNNFQSNIDLSDFIQQEKDNLEEKEKSPFVDNEQNVRNDFIDNSQNQFFANQQSQPFQQNQPEGQQFFGQQNAFNNQAVNQNQSNIDSLFANQPLNQSRQFETIATNDFKPQEDDYNSFSNKNSKSNQSPKYQDEDEDDDNGFSLFRFITGSKKPKKEVKTNNEDILQKQQVLDFSFHDNVMEDLPRNDQRNANSNNDEFRSEDEMLNVPAFFRKKDKNGN